MIDDMRRRLPPYVYRERTRHGRWVFYFRRGKGRRIRLPDDPASPEFDEAYRAALAGETPGPRREQASPQSLRWLVERYRESAAWRQLSPGTRRQREAIFLRAIRQANNPPFAAVTRAHIQGVMDKRADARPASANTFLKAMRGLFAWAVRNGHVGQDPCAGVERVKYSSDGYAPWTREDVRAFCDTHPVGTKARLAMELLLLTGLRRSDVVRVGRQHLNGDELAIRTAKTGTPVTMRLPASLLELIDATPTGDMHFVVGEHGRPYTVESFGNWFRDRCREAGVAKSAHGLRKLSATLAAEGGASAHQVMAQFGWTRIEQAKVYTDSADRARLGKEASAIVAGQIENHIPRTPVPDAPHPRKSGLKA